MSETSPAPFAPSGGTGVERKAEVTANLRLASKAVRNRYPINTELRSKMVEWLREIAEAGTKRTRLKAISVLASVDKMNQRDEEVDAGIHDPMPVIILPSGVRSTEASDDELDRRIAELEGRATATKLEAGGSGDGAPEGVAGEAIAPLVLPRVLEDH